MRYIAYSCCCFLLTCLCSVVCAVDIYIPDAPATHDRLQQHRFNALTRHAHLLIEVQSFKRAKQAGYLFNHPILSQAQTCGLHLGNNIDEWYVQMRVENNGRLAAWWQEQLESMQRIVPGIGVERDGIRFHKADNLLHMMGRAVPQIPAAFQHQQINADMIISSPQTQSAAEVFVKEDGMQLQMEMPYQGQGSDVIDKMFLSNLPQEMFIWCSLMVNDQTRASVKKVFTLCKPFLAVQSRSLPMDATRTFLNEFDGELFIGISNVRNGVELHIACSQTRISDALVAQVRSEASEINTNSFTCVKGNGRWIISGSNYIADILSGKRKIHFPQTLPTNIRETNNMVSAGYINTLALAQKYYNLLPHIKRENISVATQELHLLRQSLKQMIPNIRELTLTATVEEQKLKLRCDGIGNAAIMIASCALCCNGILEREQEQSAFAQHIYKDIQSYLKSHSAWPLELKLKAQQEIDCCYLRPEEFDFALPVIIENPARHDGKGSIVIFSNGEADFIRGRHLWNHAQRLELRSKSSQWEDWTQFHERFASVQHVQHNGFEEHEIQILLDEFED